jgi:hypothetical protein
LEVEVLAGNGDYSYQWSHGGADTAYVAGLPAGTYSVVVTDERGCQASASAVLEAPVLLSGVVAYPNPTKGIFHLLVPEDPQAGNDWYLSVINTAGQVLLETRLEGLCTNTFDFSGYRKGIYLIRLHRGEEVQQIRLLLE